jgi:guanylate kinase
MMRGLLFVISAPSGTGKTTLLNRVMSRIPGLAFSVSHTTRCPRPGECAGAQYHFVDRLQFERMIADNLFLEWAEVHNNLYGTSIQSVSDQLAGGQDVILDIDVQGAAILRKKSEMAGVQIFISPPGLAELERRLRSRATEDEESISLRLRNARVEMLSASEYNYLIVNDNLDEAADLLSSIFLAERARAHRLPSGQPIKLVL